MVQPPDAAGVPGAASSRGSGGFSGSQDASRSSAGASTAAAPSQTGPAPAEPHRNSVTAGQLSTEFQDFDNKSVYDGVIQAGLNEEALNFVVYFGGNDAKVARDLTESQFQRLLDTPNLFRKDDMPIRWINIWNPGKQRSVIEAIGHKYRFSKRLTMSIWAWDDVKRELERQRQARRKSRLHSRGHGRNAIHTAAEMTKAPPELKDLEDGLISGRPAAAAPEFPVGDGSEKAASGRNDVFAAENLATFQMMQDSLNYTSIDQEAHFVCLGANWLHRRPLYESEKTPSLVPPKHWSWFALCDDHTVLSFHEAAYYDKVPKGESEDAWKKKELKNMRSNTLKVLRQLSKCGLDEDKHKFMQLTSVRQPMISGHPERTIAPEDLPLEGSSNLFYYLFEDYSAAFDILNNSKKALDTISDQILNSAVPDWKQKENAPEIIPTLYKLNKELRQLHHLFTNYSILIDRLLSNDVESPDERPGREQLSSRACNRFKRLQVQLQSLMLGAINDYLDEKVSLQDTYFNLTAQKDSRSTERLTRGGTLLAKLSVLFLPVSFMTSYFSVQIPNLTDGYTGQTYWTAFAVIISISFMCLFFFRKLLMYFSEGLDNLADEVNRWFLARLYEKRERRALEAEDEE